MLLGSKIKTLFGSFVLAFALIGCSPSDNAQRDPQNTNFESNTLKYHYIQEGCDTYPRIAVDQAQYCRNLQWDGANNSCALRLREEAFYKNCPGETWNPHRVAGTILDYRGLHINCSVTDGDPSPSDIMAGRRYINRQHSIDPLTVIPHKQFVAVITRVSDTEKPTVLIQLADSYPEGRVFAEKKAVGTGTFELRSMTPESRVICDIEIR